MQMKSGDGKAELSSSSAAAAVCAVFFFGPFTSNEEMNHKKRSDVYIIPLHQAARRENFSTKQTVEKCFAFNRDNLTAHGSSSMIMGNALIIDECFVFRFKGFPSGLSLQSALEAGRHWL